MRKRSIRAAAFLLIAGFGSVLVSPGCNGNGRGFDLDDGGLEVTFVADEPDPGPLTLSMAGGASSGTAFDVRIRVSGIERFFGAAFRVMYDVETVRYEGFRTEGSFISEAGVATDYRAQLDSSAPGTLVVSATRQGPFAGVDAGPPQLLMTLSFDVEHAVPGSAIGFGDDTTRQVTTCPEPPAACTVVPDANLTWPGGVVVAN